MKILNTKSSWLFFLIPIGLFIFVILPEVQQKHTDYVLKQHILISDIITLDSLHQITAPTTRALSTIKRLEISIPIHQIVYQKEKFLYYKIGGMFAVFAFMGLGMFVTNYISRKKKNSPQNKTVNFTFGNPDTDRIGQQLSWAPLTSSGSNFASEVLKKTTTGYKVTSSSFTKVFAWSFFLVGLNYVSLSFIEYYQLYDLPLSFMQGGNLFFTSGGPFLTIGLILLFMFSPKVYLHTQKRKTVVNGTVLPFEDLYALQLLEKFIEGSSSGSYFCYELNIITKNGTRHNVLNHGNKVSILSDMMKLSQLLNLTVWNRGVA